MVFSIDSPSMTYQKKDYHYHLPRELIAQEAIHPHHNARMLIIDRTTGEITWEKTFRDLSWFLSKDHVIFFNNSKVIPSRLILQDAHIITKNGERKVLWEGEIFYLSSLGNNRFEALVRPGNKFKIGTTIEAFWTEFIVREITENGRILECNSKDIINILETHGWLPLPPYIDYKKEKEHDYQTIFAKHAWSVAAPTASLHFTEELVNNLACSIEYITLHVGLWTFKWIDTEDIRSYEIHGETIILELSLFEKIATYKQNRKKIVAVGTTVCRTLESLPYVWKMLDVETKAQFWSHVSDFWENLTLHIQEATWIHTLTRKDKEKIEFMSTIYITPGFNFCIIDELITNFHLPESSLLVLVSAFLTHDATLSAYKYAVEKKFRFYSFWDGMYIYNNN